MREIPNVTRNVNAGPSECRACRASRGQVCVTACLCRIRRFLEELVSLQSILLGLPASCLVGGLSVLWGGLLGGLAERQTCRVTSAWSWRSLCRTPGGAWGSWPGLDGRGRSETVMSESDASPCGLVLMPRGGRSREGVGQVPGRPG